MTLWLFLLKIRHDTISLMVQELGTSDGFGFSVTSIV